MTFSCFTICTSDVQKPKNTNKKTKQPRKKKNFQKEERLNQKQQRTLNKKPEDRLKGKENKRDYEEKSYFSPYLAPIQENKISIENKNLSSQVPIYIQSQIHIEFSGDSNKIPVKLSKTPQNKSEQLERKDRKNIQQINEQKISTKNAISNENDVKPYVILREKKKKRIFTNQEKGKDYANLKCPSERTTISRVRTLNQNQEVHSEVIVNTKIDGTHSLNPVHLTDRLMTTSAVK